MILIILCCIGLGTGIWICFKCFYNPNQANVSMRNERKAPKRGSSVDELEDSVSVVRPRHSRLDKYRKMRVLSRSHYGSRYSSLSRAPHHSSPLHVPSSRSRRIRSLESAHRNLRENTKRSRQSGELPHHSDDGFGQRTRRSHGSMHPRSSPHRGRDNVLPKHRSLKVSSSRKQAKSPRHPPFSMNSMQPKTNKPPHKSKLGGNGQKTVPPTVVLTPERLGIPVAFSKGQQQQLANSPESSSEESSSEMALTQQQMTLQAAATQLHIQKQPIVPGTVQQSETVKPSAQVPPPTPTPVATDSESEESSESSPPAIVAVIKGVTFGTVPTQHHQQKILPPPASGDLRGKASTAGQAMPPRAGNPAHPLGK